jgi:hypothetical protein
MGLSRDFTARNLAGLVDGTAVNLAEMPDGVERVVVRQLPDGRLTRNHAARYLGVEPKTLSHWLMMGKGPRCVKVGGRAFYFRADLDAFIGAAAKS